MSAQSATKSKGKVRGRPFTKADPRIGHSPGRPPKVRCIPDILQEFGALDCPEKLLDGIGTAIPQLEGRTLTIQQACMARTYIEALRGERWALEFVADRTEGKPVQATKDISERDIIIKWATDDRTGTGNIASAPSSAICDPQSSGEVQGGIGGPASGEKPLRGLPSS